jgi:hypothetical protein
MNGELIIIANQFLTTLASYGLELTEIRIRSVDQLSTYSSRLQFRNLAEWKATMAPVINDLNPELFAGNYPFVQNINIKNPQLGYPNLLRFYDILDKRKLIQTNGIIPNTQPDIPQKQRETLLTNQNRELAKTIDLINKEIDKYKNSAIAKYQEILGYYMDNGYVNPGYVETKSNLLTQ